MVEEIKNKIDETEEEADYLIASIDLSSSIKKNSFAKLSYSIISNVNSKKNKEFILFKLLGYNKLLIQNFVNNCLSIAMQVKPNLIRSFNNFLEENFLKI